MRALAIFIATLPRKVAAPRSRMALILKWSACTFCFEWFLYKLCVGPTRSTWITVGWIKKQTRPEIRSPGGWDATLENLTLSLGHEQLIFFSQRGAYCLLCIAAELEFGGAACVSSANCASCRNNFIFKCAPFLIGILSPKRATLLLSENPLHASSTPFIAIFGLTSRNAPVKISTEKRN